MLLSGLMFNLDFLVPFSSVTRALVLLSHTQRMLRQSAYGKFAFEFLLFVINSPEPNCIDFTEG